MIQGKLVKEERKEEERIKKCIESGEKEFGGYKGGGEENEKKKRDKKIG